MGEPCLVQKNMPYLLAMYGLSSIVAAINPSQRGSLLGVLTLLLFAVLISYAVQAAKSLHKVK